MLANQLSSQGSLDAVPFRWPHDRHPSFWHEYVPPVDADEMYVQSPPAVSQVVVPPVAKKKSHRACVSLAAVRPAQVCTMARRRKTRTSRPGMF